MTERLYYRDSSILEFDAIVEDISIEGEQASVRLNRSAFYPTSGGQLYDTGKIGDLRVVETKEQNGNVLHVLQTPARFHIGDSVKGVVDAARRRDNMQKHTGQHILSQSFIRICEAETISSRLGEDDCTIDLNNELIGEAEFIAAEELANQIIFENRPVTTTFVPYEELKTVPLRKVPERDEGDFRVVTIKDFDWSACGGTHCGATGAVGVIKITGREKIRGTLRLHFFTGMQALADYRWRLDQIDKIATMLTRHGKDSEAAVRQLYEDNSTLRRKLGMLKKELLPVSVAKWLAEAREIAGLKVVALDFSGEEPDDAKFAALGIINIHSAVALIGLDDKLIVAAAKDSGRSAKLILTSAISRCGGRGGGSDQMAQGGGMRPADIKVLLADPGSILNK